MDSRILIIEDDADIREGVRILLESEGYIVEEAECGEEGLKKLSADTDLVILDVMMPGMSGLKTCEEIRKVSFVPVLFLTAKAQESDKLIGFMAGGDDYLAKPFSYSELLGRVKALLRRYQVYQGKQAETQPEEDTMLRRSGIAINTEYNQVWVDDVEISLSDIEYRILLLLMKHPKMVFSAQMIYESVWDEPFFYTSNSTVTVHIRKLRIKVEKDPQQPEHIKTVWGRGYRFE